MHTMCPETTASGPTGVTKFTDDYVVETHQRIGDVDPFDWDAAVEAQGLPVFYSRTFLAAYERYPLTRIDAFAYLVVRRRGKSGPPAAVLPAYLQSRPDPLGHLATAYPESAGRPALLSHVWHCYDTHLGEPTAPAATVAAVSALRRTARELGAPWCGLVNVRLDGPAAAALAGAGLPVRHLVDRFNADLAGCTELDRFLRRSARPHARRELGRTYRRAAEQGVSRTVVAVERAELDAVAALCRGSAGRHGNDEYYPPGRFEPFLAALGPAARVVEIRQHGRLVATGVCLLDATRVHCWAGGANYRVDGNFSPYYLMFADSMRLAVDLRRPAFEGGRGNAEFKLRHGLTARPLGACLVRS
jgi:predicted N-acyltransferase